MIKPVMQNAFNLKSNKYVFNEQHDSQTYDHYDHKEAGYSEHLRHHHCKSKTTVALPYTQV
jgi:hypothetical protein